MNKRRLVAPSFLMATFNITMHVMNNACDAKPSIRPFTGRRSARHNDNNADGSEAGGLTLGDLDKLKDNNVLGPNLIFGSGTASDSHQQQMHQQSRDSTDEEATQSNPNSNQLRRSLRRINLDLSGRVMCHLISPPRNPDGNDVVSGGDGVIGSAWLLFV